MTRSILAAIALLCCSSVAQAGTPIRSGGNFGLGVGGGYWLNGLSLKYYSGDNTSLQGVIGGYGYGHGYDNDYYYGSGLGITGDFLWEMPELTNNEAFELAWSAGLGPSVGLGNNWFALGVHGTLGLEFNFNPIPIDVVLEYKPGVYVVPGVGADLWNFGGHIRIYPF